MKFRRLLIESMILLGAVTLSSCDFGFLNNNSTTPTGTLYVSDDKTNYEVGDIYDNYVGAGGLTLKFIDGQNEVVLDKAAFTYELKDSSGKSFVPTKPFSATGNYVVSVDYDDYEIDDLTIKVTQKSPTNITLSNESLNLTVGDNQKITATVTPSSFSASNIEWSSSVPSVATVSKGSITALAVGDTVITATYGKTSATCNVHVDEAVIKVTSVSFTETSKTVTVGTNFTLNATVSPNDASNKSLKWSSTNTSVASVSDGYVQTISAGTTTIKALAQDGSGKYASCSVTVNPQVTNIAVTNITLSDTTKDLDIGESFTIETTISPANATNKTIRWSSSIPAVASVKNGLVTALSTGTTTITAEASDGSGVTSTCAITVGSENFDGSTASIVFKTSSSDSTSYITTTTNLSNFISSGSNLVKVSSADRAYAGASGLKLGSSNNKGNITFSSTTTLSSYTVSSVSFTISKYGNDTCGATMSVNGTQVISASAAGTFSYNYSSPINISSIKIASSVKRVYIQNITFVIKPVTPIDPTAISIPTSLDLGIGETSTLSLTYSPSDANQNKAVTWSSEDSTIATVSNGSVKGIKAGTTKITATLNYDNSIKVSCDVTVKKISVSSVSLSTTSLELSIGNTQTLVETVYPTNATDKSVTWSSTNSSIASVNNGVVTANAIGNATITVKTTDGSKTASCDVNVSEIAKDAWTILIYMCGADLESENGLASGDIEEILSVKNQPDDVNIAIQTGGAKNWTSYSIDSSYNQRYHVENKSLVCDVDKVYSTYKSMGESSTLQDFITWGLETYPAEKTGIILWNHGGGQRGVCYDEKKSDDSLTDNEVKNAVSGALSKTGVTSKLEFIGYDACLMQLMEIAEFNSNYFNYQIGSQESESGYGWDYDTWVDDLYAKKSTEMILKAAVDGFITSNGGINGQGVYYEQGKVYYPADQTLSYLDLSKMAEFKSAWESMAAQLSSKITSSNKSSFNSNVIGKTKYFGGSDYDYFCTFDCYHFLTILENNSTFNPGTTYINNVKTAFNNLVKYNVVQKEGANDAYGLCFYYTAGTGYSQYSFNSSTYSNFTNWMNVAKNGGSISSSYSA